MSFTVSNYPKSLTAVPPVSCSEHQIQQYSISTLPQCGISTSKDYLHLKDRDNFFVAIHLHILFFLMFFILLFALFVFITTLTEYVLTISCYFSMTKKLFDEKWHQLRLLITEEDVTLYVDDLEVETLPLESPVGIFINGKTQVGKYVRKEETVPVSSSHLQI